MAQITRIILLTSHFSLLTSHFSFSPFTSHLSPRLSPHSRHGSSGALGSPGVPQLASPLALRGPQVSLAARGSHPAASRRPAVATPTHSAFGSGRVDAPW